MATIASVISSFLDVEITGVKRYYDAPPLSISTAEMPFVFIRNPKVTSGTGLTFGTTLPNYINLSFEYVIYIEQGRQSTQKDKLDLALSFLQRVATAFSVNSSSLFIDDFSSEVLYETHGDSVGLIVNTTVTCSFGL